MSHARRVPCSLPMTDPTNVFDLAGLDQLRSERQVDKKCVRRLRNSLFKRFQSDELALAGIPDANPVAPQALTLERRLDSPIDAATKLILPTSSGLPSESVLLLLLSGPTTLCVSSQVGSAAACAFCATGKMGMTGNLST